MRLSRRDAIASVVVAAIVAPYVGYLVRGDMPFIKDARGMAAVGLVGLVLSFIAWGIGMRSMFGRVLLVGGLAAIGVGIAAALVGVEGSEVLLAVFVASIVLVWAGETVFHARMGRRAHGTVRPA